MFSRQLLRISKVGFKLTKNVVSKSFASKVSIAEAKTMAKNYEEMSNDILLSMAVMGDQEAREERMIREIMATDNVTWFVLRRCCDMIVDGFVFQGCCSAKISGDCQFK